MTYVIKFLFAFLGFVGSTAVGVLAAYVVHRWLVGPLYFNPPGGILIGAAVVAWLAWRRAPTPERLRYFFGGGAKPNA